MLTFTHLESPHTWFRTVGGSQSSLRGPTQLEGEHAEGHQLCKVMVLNIMLPLFKRCFSKALSKLGFKKF